MEQCRTAAGLGAGTGVVAPEPTTISPITVLLSASLRALKWTTSGSRTVALPPHARGREKRDALRPICEGEDTNLLLRAG
jgi:hypothetical protein